MSSLNTPFGTRCFLTLIAPSAALTSSPSLNAPFGARCFLTDALSAIGGGRLGVLMHRLVLGAF